MKFRHYIAGLLASLAGMLAVPVVVVSVGVLPLAAQAETLPPVTITGINRNRWALSFQMMWDDMIASLTQSYLYYQSGLAVSSDPMLATRETDARCNSLTKDVAKNDNGGTNPNSSTPDDTQRAIAQGLINMWRGPSAQGGMGTKGGVTGWADLLSSMPRDANGFSKMTIIWADGSMTTFKVSRPGEATGGAAQAAANAFVTSQPLIKASAGTTGAGSVCPA